MAPSTRRPDRHLRCRKLPGWSSRVAGRLHARRQGLAARFRERGHLGRRRHLLVRLLRTRRPDAAERATVFRRARRSRHSRRRRRRTTLRRAATHHIAQPGRLCGTARSATRLRPVPLPTLRHCRRCDRGIHHPHPIGATDLDLRSAARASIWDPLHRECRRGSYSRKRGRPSERPSRARLRGD
jgi:hypothetical protein